MDRYLGSLKNKLKLVSFKMLRFVSISNGDETHFIFWTTIKSSELSVMKKLLGTQTLLVEVKRSLCWFASAVE